MEYKNKKKRKHYLNDFSLSVNGEYVYTGDYYRPEMDPAVFSRQRSLQMTGALLEAAFVLAAGLLPAAGSMNCFYVILPFLVVIICCFITVWKTVSLFASGLPVREYVYEKTVPVIPGWILAGVISAAATLAAETVYLAINGFDGRETGTIVFICLLGLISVTGLIIRRSFAGICWSECPEQ